MAEIRNRKQLEAWLEGKPREVSIVLASRAALRVVPFQASIATLINQTSFVAGDVILPVFRANAVVYCAAKFPKRTMGDFASTFAVAAAGAVVDAAVTAESSAAYVAADAAYAVVDAAYTVTDAMDVSDADIWMSVEWDVAALDIGMSSADLVRSLLWLKNAPPMFASDWREMVDALIGRDEDWEVWIDWYEDRLAGRPTAGLPEKIAEELDLRIALQSDEWWQRGPAAANADIKRWVAEAKEAAAQFALDLEPSEIVPGPSAFQYGLRDNKIVASPVGSLDATGFAEDVWAESLAKAQSARERLAQTQAPSHVIETLDRFIESIGQSIADVRPGILLSRSRSLDAALAMLDTAEYRDEMYSDAQVKLRDLAESLEDLRTLFPQLLEHEANRLAREISDGHLERVQQENATVVEIAKTFPDVDETAVQALTTPDDDIAEAELVLSEASDPHVKTEARIALSRLVAQKTLDIRNFAITVAKGAGYEIGRYSKDALSSARKGSLTGIEKTAEHIPKVGLTLLALKLAGPMVGLAVLGSFAPLQKRFEEIQKQLGDDDSAENDDTPE